MLCAWGNADWLYTSPVRCIASLFEHSSLRFLPTVPIFPCWVGSLPFPSSKLSFPGCADDVVLHFLWRTYCVLFPTKSVFSYCAFPPSPPTYASLKRVFPVLLWPIRLQPLMPFLIFLAIVELLTMLHAGLPLRHDVLRVGCGYSPKDLPAFMHFSLPTPSL